MDYTERKTKLSNLKTKLSGKSVDASQVTSFKKDIPEWKYGVSQNGYDRAVEKIISESNTLKGVKSIIIADINSRIDYLDQLIEMQYNSNKHLVYNFKVPTKDLKQADIDSETRQRIRNANLDSSVEKRLLAQV